MKILVRKIAILGLRGSKKNEVIKKKKKTGLEEKRIKKNRNKTVPNTRNELE